MIVELVGGPRDGAVIVLEPRIVRAGSLRVPLPVNVAAHAVPEASVLPVIKLGGEYRVRSYRENLRVRDARLSGRRYVPRWDWQPAGEKRP